MRSFEIKVGLLLLLVFMILMRLVWMDLRSYDVVYAPESRRVIAEVCGKNASSKSQSVTDTLAQWADGLPYQTMIAASCRGGVFSESSFIRYNQGLLLLTILLCMLLTRIIARSWVIALLVGVGLLSRGRLITMNGEIANGHLLMAGIAAWALGLAHWLRSGVRWIHLFSFACIVWLVSLEASFVWLLAAHLIFIRLARLPQYPDPFAAGEEEEAFGWPRLRNFFKLEVPSESKSQRRQMGSLFRPLFGSFERYLKNPDYQRHALKEWLLGSGVVLTILCGLFLLRGVSIEDKMTFFSLGKQKSWLDLWSSPFDKDLGVALLLLLLCLRKASFWMPGLYGLSLLVVLGVGLSSWGVWLHDHLASSSREWLAAELLLWWEPLLLTLGVLGFYHVLIHVFIMLRTCTKPLVE